VAELTPYQLDACYDYVAPKDGPTVSNKVIPEVTPHGQDQG
jgi:hypothetical protein